MLPLDDFFSLPLSSESPSEVVETVSEISPERLELARAAFELTMRGKTQIQIAETLGVSRSTIIRLLNEYREAYSKQLEAEPRLHLVSRELAKLEEIETTARVDADNAKTERGRQGFLKIALQASKARHELLLATGIIPREPLKILAATHSVDGKAPHETHSRTDEEIKADVEQLLRYGRRM